MGISKTKWPYGNRYEAGLCADAGDKTTEGEGGIQPSGVKKGCTNTIGTYDMSGNVWEWVDDWFSFYAKTKIKKRKAVAFSEKIVRGGSWYNSAYYINVGMRFKLNPEIKLNSIGFRCAWDVQQ